MEKYLNIREQHESLLKSRKEGETLVEIITSIDEAYFSDLKETDIFDEDISDIDESEIGLSTLTDSSSS